MSVLILLYLCTPVINDRYVVVNRNLGLRSEASVNFDANLCRTVFGSNSLFQRSHMYWSELQPEIKNSSSLNVFKKGAKQAFYTYFQKCSVHCISVVSAFAFCMTVCANTYIYRYTYLFICCLCRFWRICLPLVCVLWGYEYNIVVMQHHKRINIVYTYIHTRLNVDQCIYEQVSL